MAFNLISMITNVLTPEIINRIASALGIDRYTTQSAVGAAVPAILSGLTGVAAQPGGAQRVADAVNQQSSGVLGSLTSMFGNGDGQSSLSSQGGRILSSIFGGRDTNALASAVGRFAGMTPAKSSSLLGILAPVVMGSIAKSQDGRALDAGGISSLLASQKENIVDAMPAGFTGMLSGTGLFDTVSSTISGAARTTTAAGQEGMRAAAYAAQNVGDAGRSAADAIGRAGRDAASAAQGFSVPNWLYWAVPLFALTMLALLMIRPAERGLRTASVVPNITIDRVDMVKEVNGGMKELRTALAGVSDVASARAALPALKQASERIERVKDRASRLTSDQRRYLGQLVSVEQPTLNRWFDDVLKIPGVSDELKPTIDGLKAKLEALKEG